MKKHNWTYRLLNGRVLNIGMMHDHKKGHFMVYVDKVIVVTDKNLKETKSHSFYIDDELLEVRVFKMGNGDYHYHLHVDKETLTPLNKIRKEAKKREWSDNVKGFFAGISFLVVVSGVILFLLFSLQRRSKDDALRELEKRGTYEIKNGVISKGYFYKGYGKRSRLLYFSYIYRGKAYDRAICDLSIKKHYTPYGLEVKPQDYFEILIDKKIPHHFQVNYKKPSKNVLSRYYDLAFQQQRKYHIEQSDDYIDCLLNTAFEQKGVEAYGIIYNQDKDKNAYLRFIRNAKLEDLIKESCWEYF